MNVPVVLELIIKEGFLKFARVDGTYSPVQAGDTHFIWAQTNNRSVFEMCAVYRFRLRLGVPSPENP